MLSVLTQLYGNKHPNFATFKSDFVHKWQCKVLVRCQKNVQKETLPSNDDGQPVANLFAVDYDKEALRGGVVLKKATEI